jgi:hypothetical protein
MTAPSEFSCNNPFEALAGLSEDAPVQSQGKRGFKAHRRAALLSEQQEFSGPSDRLARQVPKGWKARSKSVRGAGSDLLNMTVNRPVGTRVPLWGTLQREDERPRDPQRAARVACALRTTEADTRWWWRGTFCQEASTNRNGTAW